MSILYGSGFPRFIATSGFGAGSRISSANESKGGLTVTHMIIGSTGIPLAMLLALAQPALSLRSPILLPLNGQPLT